jgi:flavin reductase (DIM6/NTAB) family NADH-FMN oxidoreductase RutF
MCEGEGMDAFARFVGHLDQVVLIVTACDPAGARSGCLVGFATQCSIEPPRLLVCLSKTNHTYVIAPRTELLAVHAVPADALELARLFGEQTGDDIDKFTRCSWHAGPEDVPLLDACPDRMVGRVRERVDVGDHVAHVLEPVLVEGAATAPILRFADVRSFVPGHPA